MILMAGKNRGRFLAWRHSLSPRLFACAESWFIDKNLSYKKCQYNKFEANARVWERVRIWSIHFSGPILRMRPPRVYTQQQHGRESARPATCRVWPAINFKYPFYGPITAPCFAIPLNIGPGRVSSSYLAAPFYAAILLLMKFLSLSCPGY